MNGRIIFSFLLLLALVGFVSAVGPRLYDDFSQGFLNREKWEIRPDIEGQPLMDEYKVQNEGGNFVFHTQQNEIGDRRVYLFPKRKFTTGDFIEYDTTVLSRTGTYASMVLLTGDNYIRIGIRGSAAGFDELGVAHVTLIFEPTNLKVIRETPSGQLLEDNLYLPVQDGTYEIYIGSFTGHNGLVHMDYDNFWINGRLQTIGI